LIFQPASGSKYANVPFKPGKYRIVSRGAKPGDFTVMARLSSGGEKGVHLNVTEPGTLELTQFDAKALKATFSFKAEGKDQKVSLSGTMFAPCKGSEVCKP
jgi:hypothetical protein